MANHADIDHTGIPGTGAPADILDLPTVEDDTALVLAPDGEGGVEFRAAGGGSFDPDEHMPWHILIMPQLQTPDATTGSPGINIWTDEAKVYGYMNPSSGGIVMYRLVSQNDAASWNVALAAGTWDIRITGRKSSNTAIITVSIDGSSVGTIDTYTASAPASLDTSITGVSVAATGKKVLQVSNPTKNASSAGYECAIAAIALRRTA